MKVVLAEKPSVARDLAAFLGAKTPHDGYFEGQGYQVTWALGHLVTLKEPDEYDPKLKRWSLDTLPFVPERFELKVIEEGRARKQFSVVRRLLKGATELICATDAGREGELIYRYIVELSGCVGKPATRLWLSSLTPPAIRAAFQNLRPIRDFDSLYAAARCRNEADWIVGLNATRNLTVRYGRRGLLWSAGRVQTPVLAMIVHRDDEIRCFKPEPFWELFTVYRETRFKFTGERFTKPEDGQVWLDRVLGQPFAVTKVERKQERSPPPMLYDLTELQRDMNRRFGLSAAATLQAAQSLYEDKLLTYPRTDSRYLASDLKPQIPGILGSLQAIKPAEIALLNLENLPFSGRIINDQKVSDHHAIIPTGTLPGRLSGPEQKVYDAVVTRFIAVFYPDCVKEVTSVDGVSHEVKFRARGVRVVEPGWTALYPRRKKTDKGDDGENERDDEQAMPQFAVGESGPHEPFLKQGETQPPKHFTENSLLGAMETAGKLVDDETLREALKERGLGTPATRAAIIETLLKRNYIERSEKSLLATDLGRYLIAIVQDPALQSPELTGQWEAKLKQIEQRRGDPRRFMTEIAEYTRGLIQSVDLFHVDEAKFGDCPRCGRPIIEGRRGYGCSGWRDGCSFVLWRVLNNKLNGADKGFELSLPQIRELLQRRVLLQPVTLPEVGERMLTLSVSGQVLDIPLPKPEQQSGRAPAKRGRRGGASQGESRGKRSRGPSKKPRREADPATPDETAEPVEQDDENVSPAKSRPARRGKRSEPLGKCPRCGAPVTEQLRTFGCSAWQQGCKFAIWKTMAGKRIPREVAVALLESGQSERLTGFTSKAGKLFDARLKLVDGEVKFDFS